MNPLDIIVAVMDYIAVKVTHKPRHYVHSRDRRNTLLYKKKREIAKNIWTVALTIIALILQFPQYVALSVVVAFIATFWSFQILDETFEKRK